MERLRTLPRYTAPPGSAATGVKEITETSDIQKHQGQEMQARIQDQIKSYDIVMSLNSF